MSSLSPKNRANKTRKTYKWFTLVELIVVITILVILGTIAFTQLQGFAGSARDSARIENLANLHKGFSLFQIVSGTYPMPENPVNITASGTIIGYQGFAKDQVGNIAKLSPWATRDPLDATMYTTYSVNVNQTKMQIMAFLEDGNTVTSYIPTANASTTSDYSKRFPTTIGDTIWILLNNGTGGTKNQPVQEFLSVSFTGVDMVNTMGSYTAVFSNTDKISGTGIALKAGIWGGWLVGYWDMETMTNSGLLKDLSGNGNDGICYNGSTAVVCGSATWPQFIYGSGGAGKAMHFNGTSDWIRSSDIPNNLPLGNSSRTIIAIIRPDNISNLDPYYAWIVSYWLRDKNTGTLLAVNGSSKMLSQAFWWYDACQTSWDIITTQNNKFVGYVYDASRIWKIHFFMDGKFLQESNLWGNYTTTDSKNWPIAIGSTDFPGRLWNGSLDEVRIYNRALSDSDIQSLYNAMK